LAEQQAENSYQELLNLTAGIFQTVGGQKAFDALKEVLAHQDSSDRILRWSDVRKNNFYLKLLLKATSK
jgi:hypothetical protein